MPALDLPDSEQRWWPAKWFEEWCEPQTFDTHSLSWKLELDGPSEAELAMTERVKIAKRITEAVGRMIPHVGTVKLTALLQLLKRDISRCHDLLRDKRSETDYVSVVAIVENALAGTNWKQLTEKSLERLKSALAVGEVRRRVTYTDFKRVRDELIAGGLLGGPAFDYGDAVTAKPDG
jgi:hypothetical protein